MSDQGNGRSDETVRASYILGLELAARAVAIEDAERIEDENPLGWRQFRSYPLGRRGRRVQPAGGAE